MHGGAPPIFSIYGTNDALVFVEDARDSVQTMRANSSELFLNAELPGAQYGFDLFHSVRTEFAIAAIEQFLMYCYNRKKG